MPSKKDGFKGISLRTSLVNQVEVLVKPKESGYRSAAEFISEAIRLRLEDLKKES